MADLEAEHIVAAILTSVTYAGSLNNVAAQDRVEEFFMRAELKRLRESREAAERLKRTAREAGAGVNRKVSPPSKG